MQIFAHLLLPVVIAVFLYISSFSQSSNLFEHFTSKTGLPSDKIYDALQSNDGNIWFATAQGVCRFDGFSFSCYHKNNGLGESEIIGLLYDHNGKLWCWSATNHIYYFEHDRFFSLKNNPAIAKAVDNKIINSIAFAQSNDLYISTVIAGNLLKTSNGELSEVQLDSKNDFSFFIKQTDAGNFVSGAINGKGENNKLMVFLNKKVFSIPLSESGHFSKTSLCCLREHEFLYAKGQEIIHFNSEKIIQRSFTEKNVQKIIRDSEGKIWVGLYTGGAICYPEGVLSSSGALNYLGNKSVSSILEDNIGNIWFTTLEDGIYYLSARTNLVYSPPKVYSEKSEPGSTEAEAAKAISPQDIQSFSGAMPNTRVISTENALYDSMPPSIYITGIKIMEQDTLIQEHYILPYNQNFLKINFAGFAHHEPEALKYKYKLEGIDNAWTYTDHTLAQYTTLPAGKYFFSVNAMSKNGIWSDSPATVSFTIEQPFWKTWWFISMTIVTAMGMIITSFFVRIKQIKKREKEKSEITRQMANAELQALRAQMNPHFIFNTLSSIQHFITLNETESALKYLSKFSKLMRKIMDNSRKPSVPVKDEIEALQLYLELEMLRFKNKFEFTVKIDEKIDVNDDEIPPMLIQPYIENSILHGIMNKDGNGTISVEIKKGNGQFVCVVEDDGIGREKSKQLNSENKNKHVSSGMSITKNRLEILNALHKSRLNVNITDLKDIHQNAAGTRVEIFIPA